MTSYGLLTFFMVFQYGETVTCAVNFDCADDVCFSCVFSSFFLYICCCVLLCFLIFSMKAFCYRFEYSSLLRQHKFDILSAAVKFCLMTLCLSDLLHVNLEILLENFKISKVWSLVLILFNLLQMAVNQ